MENKPRSLGRDMMLHSVGSMFYLTCQWLLTVLVVPLCSFEGAGMLSLSISLTNVFFTLGTFGIRIFQVSDGAGKYSPSRYISTRTLTCMTAFGLCVIFTLCNRQYSPTQMLCIIFYMIFRLSEALVDVLAGEEQRAYRLDLVGLSFILRGAVMLGSFTVMLMLTHELPLTLAVMGLCTLGTVLLFDGRRVHALTNFRVHVSLRESLPLMKEAWPLMLNSLLLTATAAIPRYFLELYHGSELLGFFGSVSTPAVIIQAGCSFIYTPLVAPLTERFTPDRMRDFRRMLLIALGGVGAFAALMFAGAAILGDWGLALLFGERILPYAHLLLPALGTALCVSLIYFFEVVLTIGRRLRTMTAIHLCFALTAAAASLLLIPARGVSGLLTTLYLCSGGDALVMALASWRMCRKGM